MHQHTSILNLGSWAKYRVRRRDERKESSENIKRGPEKNALKSGPGESCMTILDLQLRICTWPEVQFLASLLEACERAGASLAPRLRSLYSRGPYGAQG